MNKILCSIICFLILSTFVNAWTPPSDADFRNYYGLYNVTTATIGNLTVSGSISGNIDINQSIDVNDTVDSNELDNLCSIDDRILRRNGGTWECFDDTAYYDDTDTNTNCSSEGICPNIAYLDHSNPGNLNVSNGNDICIEGDKCLSELGISSADITGVFTNGLYLIGGAASGDVYLLINETKLNETINTNAISDESTLNVNSSDYWDNLNTESELTPSNFLTSGNYLSYTGDTLNVANQDILDASTINASQVQNFNIAGPAIGYIPIDFNMSDESILYYNGNNTFAEEGSFGEVTIAGENITSGTVADARIASTIARDSELIPDTNETTRMNNIAGYSCSADSFVDSFDINGNPGCSVDSDTTYTASGTLLDLTGETFSINEGTLTDDNFCNYGATGTQLECTNTAIDILANSANIDASGNIKWEDASDLDLNGDVIDDSHNHVYSNIDPFTEANLYSILSDVTEFIENNDAATLDEVTLGDGGELNDNSTCTTLESPDGGTRLHVCN